MRQQDIRHLQQAADNIEKAIACVEKIKWENRTQSEEKILSSVTRELAITKGTITSYVKINISKT